MSLSFWSGGGGRHLLKQNTQWGALIRKGALIATTALIRIITVGQSIPERWGDIFFSIHIPKSQHLDVQRFVLFSADKTSLSLEYFGSFLNHLY